MFEVRKLKLEDLEQLSKEPLNRHVKQWFERGTAQAWAQQPETVSAFVHNELMACAGFTEFWTGRAYLWALFSSKAEHHFVTVFRGVKRFLNNSPYRRIEMDVPLGDEFTYRAHRRAMLLGFTLECARAKGYRPNGGDSALYAFVKGS
jgi:hypothetical protein